ncbi:MAG: hypothetical protein ACREQ5_07785 [Candidatus Dormibacteria bacterium]
MLLGGLRSYGEIFGADPASVLDVGDIQVPPLVNPVQPLPLENAVPPPPPEVLTPAQRLIAGNVDTAVALIPPPLPVRAPLKVAVPVASSSVSKFFGSPYVIGGSVLLVLVGGWLVFIARARK